MTRLPLSETIPASTLKQTLAANLATFCASRRMIQTALSERSGVAASHISHMQNLADVLDITVIDLLTPISAKPRLPE